MGSEAALLGDPTADDWHAPAADVDWPACGALSAALARATDRPALLRAALQLLRGPIGAAAAAVWEYRDDGHLEVAGDDGLGDDDTRPAWTDLFKTPLSSGGKLIGVLEAYSLATDGFSDDQRAALQMAAALLADALCRLRLAAAAERRPGDETAERLEELEAVWRLWRATATASSLHEVFEGLLVELPDTVPYDAAAYLDLTGEPTCILHLRDLARDQVPDLIERLQHGAAEHGAAPELSPERVMLVGVDLAPLEGPPLGAGVAVPISSDHGLLGLLFLATHEPDRLTEQQVRVLTSYAAHAADAVDRVRLMRAVEIERLQTMIDSLPMGVVLLDVDGRRLLTNPAGRRSLALLGADGERVSRLGRLDLNELLREAAEQRLDLIEREVEVRAANQSFNFAVSLVPVSDRGEPLGTVLSIEDISARRQSESRLFQDARLAAVGDFAAGLAHELNNPLMIILGLAESLADSGDAPADWSPPLAEIQAAALRAADIVGQVTRFADTQAEASWDHLDLREVLDPALALVATQCGRDGIEMTVDWPASLPPVMGNAGQLQQIALFLVHNAREAIIQHDGPRGDEPRIAVSCGSDGTWLWLEVADNGPGVDPALAERIFEVFFTTKHDWKGKGLGLSIAARLARDHGGDLTLQPSETGARFRLRLPLRA